MNDLNLLIKCPDGATAVDTRGQFWKRIKLDDYMRWSERRSEWVDGFRPTTNIRLIEDIRHIVRLEESLSWYQGAFNALQPLRYHMHQVLDRAIMFNPLLEIYLAAKSGK